MKSNAGFSVYVPKIVNDIIGKEKKAKWLASLGGGEEAVKALEGILDRSVPEEMKHYVRDYGPQDMQGFYGRYSGASLIEVDNLGYDLEDWYGDQQSNFGEETVYISQKDGESLAAKGYWLLLGGDQDHTCYLSDIDDPLCPIYEWCEGSADLLAPSIACFMYLKEYMAYLVNHYASKHVQDEGALYVALEGTKEEQTRWKEAEQLFKRKLNDLGLSPDLLDVWLPGNEDI